MNLRAGFKGGSLARNTTIRSSVESSARSHVLMLAAQFEIPGFLRHMTQKPSVRGYNYTNNLRCVP
jgi:hypothetical protein